MSYAASCACDVGASVAITGRTSEIADESLCLRAAWCRDQMSETAVLLDQPQRDIVNQVVREHCGIRGWTLHAVNCRSNHCHVVVTAVNYAGEQVRDQFKSWAKRRLK